MVVLRALVHKGACLPPVFDTSAPGGPYSCSRLVIPYFASTFSPIPIGVPEFLFYLILIRRPPVIPARQTVTGSALAYRTRAAV